MLLKVCVETIRRVREIPGVAGVHVMAIEWEDRVPGIVDAAGLSVSADEKVGDDVGHGVEDARSAPAAAPGAGGG